MDTGRIDERHLAHTDDTHLGTVTELGHKFLELGSYTEEIRTIDFINLHALRDSQTFVIRMDARLVLHLDFILDS